MATTKHIESSPPKPVFWLASSRKGIKRFPKRVRQVFGQALFDAQTGGKHPDAKPLKGFRGAGVLEVVEDDDGSKTPPAEINKVNKRLNEASTHYAEWAKEREKNDQR